MFDRDRFLAAQPPVFPAVLAELDAGRERTRWMWFVFPQLRGHGEFLSARWLPAHIAHRTSRVTAQERAMTRSVFRFEGFAGRGQTALLSPETEGFPILFTAVDRAVRVGGDGLDNVIEAGSGRAAGVNPAGISATFGAEERFDLRSGIFAAVRADELTLTVTGFRDGVEVAERVFTLTQDAERLRFGRDFRDLDFVQFRPSGTFDGSNPFNPLADNFFAVDNLAIRSTDADPFG